MSGQHPLERRKVVFRGRVQGVGFRFTTQRVAREYEVTGYVKNLPSGEVELVAEGRSEEIAGFVAEVERTMTHYIQTSQSHAGPYTGEFEGFTVRH